MAQRHDDMSEHEVRAHTGETMTAWETEHRHGRTLLQQYMAVGRFFLREAMSWMQRRHAVGRRAGFEDVSP